LQSRGGGKEKASCTTEKGNIGRAMQESLGAAAWDYYWVKVGINEQDRKGKENHTNSRG